MAEYYGFSLIYNKPRSIIGHIRTQMIANKL